MWQLWWLTLVRGRFSKPDLAKLGHVIHRALLALCAQGYWEYVQSKSDWADDISRFRFWRLMVALRCHGFSFHSPYLPLFSSICLSLQPFWPLNSSSALGVVVRWVIPAKTGFSLGWPGSLDQGSRSGHWSGAAHVSPCDRSKANLRIAGDSRLNGRAWKKGAAYNTYSVYIKSVYIYTLYIYTLLKKTLYIHNIFIDYICIHCIYIYLYTHYICIV